MYDWPSLERAAFDSAYGFELRSQTEYPPSDCDACDDDANASDCDSLDSNCRLSSSMPFH